MWISEQLLYLLVRAVYRTDVCQDREMKEAERDIDKYDEYRAGRIDHILEAAGRYGVPMEGRAILDFGCGNGIATGQYLQKGASSVIGVDVNGQSIERAKELYGSESVRFIQSGSVEIPLEDQSVDTVVSYDVFEHVGQPDLILDELYRVLRPNGKVLIGTFGWRHPFAPHLYATMPVPWAHCVFSEKTILRACRRVYLSPWYVATHHDMDSAGNKKPDKYRMDEIPLDYVNKLLLRDFDSLFQASKFQHETYPIPFSSKWARWTRVFLGVPWLREYITAYIWVVLNKTAAD